MMEDIKMDGDDDDDGRIIWCPPEDENVRLALIAARARGKPSHSLASGNQRLTERPTL